jgi:hypothetical protein
LFSTISVANEYEYSLRDGNRMEGIKNDVPSALYDISVISFTAYREDIKPSSNDTLKLMFYVPSHEPIFVSVSEKIPLHHYYMEPMKNQWDIGWQLFDGWPASAVLIPKKIYPSGLGVVARMSSKEPGGGRLSPVLFYIKKRPDKVSTYELSVVSGNAFSVLSCQLKRWESTSIHSTFVESEDPEDDIAADTPITFRFDLTGEKEGWFEITLDATVKDQIDGPLRMYYFYHKPGIGLSQ